MAAPSKEYGDTLVTLNGVTKPLSEWAEERDLTLQQIRNRRMRNSWAEALQPGNLKGKTLRREMFSKGQ